MKYRTILPALVAASLFSLANSSADAFELLERVMLGGGVVQKDGCGASQKGGCGAAQKGGCGASQKGDCGGKGAAQKGAAQKGCGLFGSRHRGALLVEFGHGHRFRAVGDKKGRIIIKAIGNQMVML